MPTQTTQNIELSLTLNGTEVACQIIDLKLTLPGETTGDTVQVACPDGTVVEPGDFEDGSLTGTVFTDTLDQGVSWLLMQAKLDGATIDYVLTWFKNEDATVAFTMTGKAQVTSWEMDWAKPGTVPAAHRPCPHRQARRDPPGLMALTIDYQPVLDAADLMRRADKDLAKRMRSTITREVNPWLKSAIRREATDPQSRTIAGTARVRSGANPAVVVGSAKKFKGGASTAELATGVRVRRLPGVGGRLRPPEQEARRDAQGGPAHAAADTPQQQAGPVRARRGRRRRTHARRGVGRRHRGAVRGGR